MRDATKPSNDTLDDAPEVGANSGIRRRSAPPSRAVDAPLPATVSVTVGRHGIIDRPATVRPPSSAEPDDTPQVDEWGHEGEHVEIGAIVDACSIRPGCLDVVVTRCHIACLAPNIQKIRAFIDAHPHLRDYRLLSSRHLCERSVLVAAEIVGDDAGEQGVLLEQKAVHHLFMSVGMVTEWVLDDTLDTTSNADPEFVAATLDFFARMITTDPPDMAERVATVRAGSIRHGIPEAFVDVLTLLLRWRRSLAVAARIPQNVSSLSVRILRGFLASYLKTRKHYASWEMYELHRAVNCGMPLEVLHGAYWQCRRLGLDPTLMEPEQERFLALLYRYGVLGGLSNDIFSYEKDLEEGVATAVEAVKHTMAHAGDDEDANTHAAFAYVINVHNERLNELGYLARSSRDPIEYAVFFSCLRAVRAIWLLHQEHRAIYDPGWLRKVLRAREEGPPG